MSQKHELKRINVRVGKELIGWFEDQSSRLGIATNALIVMAMKEYMKQEISVSAMPGILEQVRRSASDSVT